MSFLISSNCPTICDWRFIIATVWKNIRVIFNKHFYPLAQQIYIYLLMYKVKHYLILVVLLYRYSITNKFVTTSR